MNIFFMFFIKKKFRASAQFYVMPVILDNSGIGLEGSIYAVYGYRTLKKKTMTGKRLAVKFAQKIVKFKLKYQA